MNQADVDAIEEVARRFLVEQNDQDGKTLASFVLNYVRDLAADRERLRVRVNAFEEERPTAPEIAIVIDDSSKP